MSGLMQVRMLNGPEVEMGPRSNPRQVFVQRGSCSTWDGKLVMNNNKYRIDLGKSGIGGVIGGSSRTRETGW